MRWLVVVALLVPWPAAAQVDAAEDAYGQAVEAYNAGHYSTGLDLFRRALVGLERGSPLFASTLYNLGRTVQALQKTTPDPEQACEGAAWYAQFIQVADSHDARLQGALADAHAGQAALQRLCTAREVAAPPPAPAAVAAAPVRPDGDQGHLLAWSLTGGAVALVGAGVAFNFLARDSVSSRDAAYRRYESAATDEAARAEEARARDLDGQARGRALVSYVLLGSGAAVAGAAVWAWLRRSPGGVVGAVDPGSRTLVLTGAW